MTNDYASFSVIVHIMRNTAQKEKVSPDEWLKTNTEPSLPLHLLLLKHTFATLLHMRNAGPWIGLYV